MPISIFGSVAQSAGIRFVEGIKTALAGLYPSPRLILAAQKEKAEGSSERLPPCVGLILKRFSVIRPFFSKKPLIQRQIPIFSIQIDEIARLYLKFSPICYKI